MESLSAALLLVSDIWVWHTHPSYEKTSDEAVIKKLI